MESSTMNWSNAFTACNTTKNTSTPVTNATWKLATLEEWKKMIGSAGGYDNLRDGFTSVGGTNMQSDCYWSSTENYSARAWYYNFAFDYWNGDDKVNDHYVRSCLAF